ncbi:MAG TPA: hypothetical protein VGS97_23245 [Actinocrinis sp.]|uniref:hypothetical protein n=1 Tax=Actinocrinis sp. TaxID=1920516 RepID=UPI002DDDAB57|nr:hypothetical protein [Actinocrinis sp.]HEV2347037.1 hypothetical protein [Actinocrinis sp.]
MPANSHPFNPAAALAEHLADRVRDAANTLTATVETITGPTPPPGGYTPVTITLRRLLDALTEQTVTYDLYAGPGLEAVAAALGISERTARTRYGGGPRELPLLIALDES